MWGAISILMACGACASPRDDMLHFLREHEHHVSAIEYRVDVPDVITISSPSILEIDQERQIIQPDGKINLRLIGEVKIAGMTAREIAAKLELLLSRYYVDPKVRITVSAVSKKYYMINQAGTVESRRYTGRDTLLDAVVSGNIDFRSWTSQVTVLRPTHGEATVRKITVDVNQLMHAGDWSKNILLEPDDIVVIPPTPFSWAAQRVREVLYPLGPAVQAYTAPATLLYLDDAYEDANGGRIGFGYGIPPSP